MNVMVAYTRAHAVVLDTQSVKAVTCFYCPYYILPLDSACCMCVSIVAFYASERVVTQSVDDLLPFIVSFAVD